METDSYMTGTASRAMQVEREECVLVAGSPTAYRFCAFRFARAQYYAEITRDGARAAAYLGEDRTAAIALFERLVCGTVTPCTLCDIVADLQLQKT